MTRIGGEMAHLIPAFFTKVAICCGRICLGEKKINFSTVFAGQAVGIKEVHDDIWLVSFMNYDLGYFGLETPANSAPYTANECFRLP
jgi:hypothetical protein